MKVDIIFYDRKTQKETGKKEFGLLSAFFYARYVLKDKKIIEKLYSEYGHPMTKKTCLWLKNLPLLKPTNIVEPEFVICADGKRYSKVHVQTFSIKDPQERAKIRSKTFWGIADAMASQWGNYNIE